MGWGSLLSTVYSTCEEHLFVINVHSDFFKNIKAGDLDIFAKLLKMKLQLQGAKNTYKRVKCFPRSKNIFCLNLFVF